LPSSIVDCKAQGPVCDRALQLIKRRAVLPCCDAI